MTATRASIEAVADRWRHCLIGYQFDPELFSPDFVLWKNVDGRERDLARVQQDAKLESSLGQVSHDSYRRYLTESGFLEQFRAVFPAKNPAVHIDICFVVHVRDGRITRADEYLDSRQARELFPTVDR